MKGSPSYLTRFEHKSAPIAWSAHDLRNAVVPDLCVAPLLAAAHAEGDTRREIAKARRAGLLRDPVLARFFARWILEEDEHAKVFLFLAQSQGWDNLDLTSRHSAPERLRYRLSPLGLRLSSLASGTPQAFLGVGAAGEFVTRTLYQSMARRVDDRALSELLRGIARQEARHQAFFVAAARDQSTPLRSQRLAIRALLVRAWNPVGMDRLGCSTWHRVFGPLLEYDDVRADLAKMDRVLDAIPALRGLGLMARFLESSGGLTTATAR